MEIPPEVSLYDPGCLQNGGDKTSIMGSLCGVEGHCRPPPQNLSPQRHPESWMPRCSWAALSLSTPTPPSLSRGCMHSLAPFLWHLTELLLSCTFSHAPVRLPNCPEPPRGAGGKGKGEGLALTLFVFCRGDDH